MILVDANVLIHAYDGSSTHHEPCRVWLERAFNSRETIGVASPTALAFIRLVTNRKILANAMDPAAACAIVNSWFERTNVHRVDPGPQFWQLLEQTLREGRASGALTSDAALVAMALENGASICTLDRDFRRFERVKLLDPTEE
jgi:hypothetical protein